MGNPKIHIMEYINDLPKNSEVRADKLKLKEVRHTVNPIAFLTTAAGLTISFIKNRITGIPLAVNYDITYRCNLNCEHCYFRMSNPKPTDLPDEVWKNVFRYHAKKLGIRSAAITGGEPTLRMNLIEEAYRTFPSIQVATNGTIKIPEHIRCTIWCSVDGTEETHNKIRGARIYKKVCENIRDDPRVTISMTISTSNYREIEQTVENMIKLGVSGIFFMFYSCNRNDPLYLKGEKRKKAMTVIKKMVDEYPDFVIYSHMMADCAYEPRRFNRECIFLNNNLIQSYFPNMEPKRCVMGNSCDCDGCSCIVPILAYCIKRLDGEIISRIPLWGRGLKSAAEKLGERLGVISDRITEHHDYGKREFPGIANGKPYVG